MLDNRAGLCYNNTVSNGLVAQLGERRVRNAEVEGSNPLLSTMRGQTEEMSVWSLKQSHGGVPVSTGMWRQDKRAAVPDRLKTGTL